MSNLRIKYPDSVHATLVELGHIQETLNYIKNRARNKFSHIVNEHIDETEVKVVHAIQEINKTLPLRYCMVKGNECYITDFHSLMMTTYIDKDGDEGTLTPDDKVTIRHLTIGESWEVLDSKKYFLITRINDATEE